MKVKPGQNEEPISFGRQDNQAKLNHRIVL